MGPSPVPTVPNRLSRPCFRGGSDSTPPAATMAQSRALLLLLLLPPQLQLGLVFAVRAPVFGRSGTHSLSPEENEFVEEEPVLVLSPEELGPGPATINCPRDCACSQEGVVDCGGIDLHEFPGDLPEHTNHLSLQVRPALHQWSPGAAPTLAAPAQESPRSQLPACPEPPVSLAPHAQTWGARAGQKRRSGSMLGVPSVVLVTEHHGITHLLPWEGSVLRPTRSVRPCLEMDTDLP